jgi:hypothetical protein
MRASWERVNASMSPVRDQEPFASVLDDLAGPAWAVHCDEGQSLAHRLEQHHGEPFRALDVIAKMEALRSAPAASSVCPIR